MNWFPPFFCSSALALSVVAQSLEFDLAEPPPGSAFTRVYGHGSPGDGAFGVPVCGGFDVDGDGFNDYAFAQFLGSPLGRPRAGVVTLVFGDGRVVDAEEGEAAQVIDKDANTPRTDILHIAGAEPYESTGSEIWMDDVNGDGMGDLLIARQNYSLSEAVPTRPGAGALTIVFGSPALRDLAAENTGGAQNHLDLAAVPAGVTVLTFVGQQSYGRLGIWMRTGDITGDRIADILVGADEEDAPGRSITYNSGACYVIRGGGHLSDGEVAQVDLLDFGAGSFPEAMKGHVARITPPADSADYHFGGTVQVADLDPNGRAEVVIAATLNRAGASIKLPDAPDGTGEGRGGSIDGTVFILWDENFPPTPWPEDYALVADASAPGRVTRIDGGRANRSFGEELIGGLDFSGDGLPELFVGDLVTSPLGRFSAGEGYVFYAARMLRGLDFSIDALPAGLAMSRIQGPVRGAISSDTVLQGDFDLDGIGDLAIGNPHDNPVVNGSTRLSAGSVSVLYGQPGGWPATIDLLPENLPLPEDLRLAQIIGAKGSVGGNTGDTLCYSAASGDIDGDGVPDLIINEMVGDGLGGSPADVGNLVVVSGVDLLVANPLPLSGAPPGGLDFGTVGAEAGSSVLELTLVNQGSVPMLLGEPRVEARSVVSDFSIVSGSGGIELAPSATLRVQLRFEPGTAGYRFATLVLPSEAGTLRVALRGLSAELAGTDLLDLTPVFRDRGSQLSVQSEKGLYYRLSGTGELSDWIPVSVVEGTGSMLYFNLGRIAQGSNQLRFYQLSSTSSPIILEESR